MLYPTELRARRENYSISSCPLAAQIFGTRQGRAIASPRLSGRSATCAAKPVASHELVPEGGQHVRDDEREQDVRQITVHVLGGMKRWHDWHPAEVHLEQAQGSPLSARP